MIIVGGFAIEQQVAHAATDEIGGEFVLAQSTRDPKGLDRFGRREVHFFFHRKGRKGINQAISLRCL